VSFLGPAVPRPWNGSSNGDRLATTALLAACTDGKTIADEQAARTAVAEETAAATD
jgi:hypothetical protein